MGVVGLLTIIGVLISALPKLSQKIIIVNWHCDMSTTSYVDKVTLYLNITLRNDGSQGGVFYIKCSAGGSSDELFGSLYPSEGKKLTLLLYIR